MVRTSARVGFGLLGAAVVTAAGAWWSRSEVISRVESKLSHHGLRWGSRTTDLDRVTWAGLGGAGLDIGSLGVDLVPRPTGWVRDVDMDVAAWLKERPESASQAAVTPSGEVPITVEAVGVDVRWADVVLLSGASGQLLPVLELTGEGGRVRQSQEGLELSLTRDVEEEGLSGALTLNAACVAAGCDVDGALVDAVVRHELLAASALELGEVRFSGRWSRTDGRVEGTVHVGPVAVAVAGTVGVEPLSGVLDVEVADVALSAVVDVFGRAIPEAASAEIVGTVGLSAQLDLEQQTMDITPRADGLGAGGVLPDAQSLRRGQVTWKAPGVTADDWVLRTTGVGTASFTPLARAGLMPEAVIASEDAGFWSHGGYDLGAIEEALKAWSDEPDSPLRGGSTLTQQLAKNLFLDGRDRTLARKLRELLYALEMERLLGKERILELYLNVVELGPRIYGVTEASEVYFVKSPERLTPREAAFLAVLLPSPRRLAEQAWLAGRTPDRKIEAILDNMVDGRALTRGRAEAAKRAPLRILPPPR